MHVLFQDYACMTYLLIYSLPLESVQSTYANIAATLKHVVTLSHSSGIGDGDFSGSLELAADPRRDSAGPTAERTSAAAVPPAVAEPQCCGSPQLRRSAIGCIRFVEFSHGRFMG